MSVMLRTKSRRRLARTQTAPRVGLAKARAGAQKKAVGALPYAATVGELTARGAIEARERLNEALAWAEPRLEQASKAVQKDIAPKVSDFMNDAVTRSEPLREEAMERGFAALAALRGELPKEAKRRRWTTAMLFFALGGAAGAAGSMFARRAPAVRAIGERVSSSMPTSSSSSSSEPGAHAGDGAGRTS